MNNKGFTLMEILAVLLILAVVVSFALPGIRLIRDEVQHSQAKSAASKMAEAMRSFYHDTKGLRVVGTLVGKLRSGEAEEYSVIYAAAQSCNDRSSTGIPTSTTGGTTGIRQLFACGYLSTKDFAGLPYSFTADGDLFENDVLIRARGTTDAGRHAGEGWCVYRDSSIAECR